jgi:DNA-binding CsgD family transcriptional regulator
MTTWPRLNRTERRILEYCLEAETARSNVIARALGYTPEYVRHVLASLRARFGVRETAALLLRADRTRLGKKLTK